MHGEADEQYRQVGVGISRRSHRCSWIGGWRRWQTPAADGSIGVVVSEATTLDEALAVALPGGDSRKGRLGGLATAGNQGKHSSNPRESPQGFSNFKSWHFRPQSRFPR